MDSTKAGNYPTTTATPTFERESFFSLNHILDFILWCIPIPGFQFLVFLELGRQPEVGAQKKNWNFFQNFLKKWWKTYSNTYQHHHRVIWYQGLRIWHRHVRTTITFSYGDHFTFPTFYTLAWCVRQVKSFSSSTSHRQTVEHFQASRTTWNSIEF